MEKKEVVLVCYGECYGLVLVSAHLPFHNHYLFLCNLYNVNYKFKILVICIAKKIL